MALSIPTTDETKTFARQVIWFEPREKSLVDVRRLVAYAITYGTKESISVLRKYLTDDELREALRNAPPGIIDARSWTYWHLKLGFGNVPPLPHRTFA